MLPFAVVFRCCLRTHFAPLITSVFGWDHVTQGLVQLGFCLMDSFGPKPGPFGKTAEGPATVARTPAQLACKLGRQALLQGFKVVDFKVQVITTIYQNHNQSNDWHTFLTDARANQRRDFGAGVESAGDKDGLPGLSLFRWSCVEKRVGLLGLNFVLTFFSPALADLFSDIVISAPMMLLESSARLTETFDHLSYLPLTTVQGLLKAIQVQEDTQRQTLRWISSSCSRLLSHSFISLCSKSACPWKTLWFLFSARPCFPGVFSLYNQEDGF